MPAVPGYCASCNTGLPEWHATRCPICGSTPRTSGRRTNRSPIKRAKRKRIYKRDGYKCVKCKSTDDLSIDHKKPRCLGGTNADSNLQTLCRPCNNLKGDLDYSRWLAIITPRKEATA